MGCGGAQVLIKGHQLASLWLAYSRPAIAASQLSHALRLPLGISIILATARALQARLYTLDSGFEDHHDVELLLQP